MMNYLLNLILFMFIHEWKGVCILTHIKNVCWHLQQYGKLKENITYKIHEFRICISEKLLLGYFLTLQYTIFKKLYKWKSDMGVGVIEVWFYKQNMRNPCGAGLGSVLTVVVVTEIYQVTRCITHIHTHTRTKTHKNKYKWKDINKINGLHQCQYPSRSYGQNDCHQWGS